MNTSPSTSASRSRVVVAYVCVYEMNALALAAARLCSSGGSSLTLKQTLRQPRFRAVDHQKKTLFVNHYEVEHVPKVEATSQGS